jgi:hypothetical protein
MSFDIVLLAIVMAGIVLSAVYVRAEYIRWHEAGAAERRRESAVRALHAARLSQQHIAATLPSVFKLQGFGDDEAASAENAANLGCLGAAGNDSSHSDPFTERRKRQRKCASQ